MYDKCIQYTKKMFNPELRYLIAEDNGEVEPIIEPKLFEGIIDYIGLISTAIILSLASYNGISLLNGILTQGQEWIEIMLIALSISLFVICKLIADFVLNDLNASFEKLKNESEEKGNKIEEKDNKIKILEKTIQLLSNTNNELKQEIMKLSDNIEQLTFENDDLKIENQNLNNNLLDQIRQDDEEFSKLEQRIKTSYITTDLFEDSNNYYNKLKKSEKNKDQKSKKWASSVEYYE